MTNTTLYFFQDTFSMFRRSMKHFFRSIDTIITVCIMPISIMILMVYVFGGALGGQMSRAEYIEYSLPGILLIAAASSVAYTSVRVFEDVKNGFFDRFKSMPVSAFAALWAHVLTSLVSTFLTLGMVVFAAFLIGFRTSAGIRNWLGIAGIMAIFTLALTWIALIAGLKASTAEGAGAFSYPLIFLPFISSAFLPTETMPSFLRGFAEHQPVTTVVESLRSIFMSETVGSEIWMALAWCVGIMMIAHFIAAKIYQKKA